MYRGERTTTMSVIVAPSVGGNAADSASFARSDCGLFVGFPCVVNAPPSSPPIATTATTTRTTQAPIVRHGCRALLIASVCVESVIRTGRPEFGARLGGARSAPPPTVAARARRAHRRSRLRGGATPAGRPSRAEPQAVAFQLGGAHSSRERI